MDTVSSTVSPSPDGQTSYVLSEQKLGKDVNLHDVIGGVVANEARKVGILANDGNAEDGPKKIKRPLSGSEERRIRDDLVKEFSGGEPTIQRIWQSARERVANAMAS